LTGVFCGDAKLGTVGKPVGDVFALSTFRDDVDGVRLGDQGDVSRAAFFEATD
jgi:hypothetical protein